MTIRTKQNKPAEYRHAVVVACDENFMPYAAFLLNQVLRLENTRKFDVCLVSEDSFWGLRSVESGDVRYVQLADFVADGELPTNRHLSKASYLRLFLPAILASDYDRILYLDSDIFLSRAGLSNLFQTDLEGYSVAAVRDVYPVIFPRRPMPDFRLMGLKDVAYFNSGVLLIDCKRFVATDLEARCLEFIHRRPDVAVLYADQTALNCVLRGDWKELHPKWNWMYNLWTMNIIESEGPYVIHFVGETKPWRNVNGETPRKYYDAYSDFFKTRFPQVAAAMPRFRVTDKTKRRLRRYLLKNWYVNPRMRRYIDSLTNDPVEP